MEKPLNATIAICGPSGVGKGYLKEQIKRHVSAEFVEPVVYTTRQARIDDGVSRRAGINVSNFHNLVEAGEVVLPHQPFRDIDSPWYGFGAESLAAPDNILTEVHSTVLADFQKRLAGRKALTLCLISDDATRVANILNRDGDISDVLDFQRRVHMGRLEVEEINSALNNHVVDIVLDCSIGRRDHAQHVAVDFVRGFLEGRNYEQPLAQ